MKLQRSPRSNSLKNEKPIVKDMVVNRRPSRHVKQAKDAAISAFLPAMVLEQIARRNIHDGKTGKLKESPSMKKYSGVILITDISGFVSIAESLATGVVQETGNDFSVHHRQNSLSQVSAIGKVLRHDRSADGKGYGSEKLSRLLNAYFGQFIQILENNCGDVISIAGDAVITAFHRPNSLKKNCWQAYSAAQTAIAQLNGKEMNGIPLHLHLAMSSGSFNSCIVGGLRDRWMHFVCGEPLTSLEKGLNFASSGQLVVTKSCWDILHTEPIIGTKIEENYYMISPKYPNDLDSKAYLSTNVMDDTLVGGITIYRRELCDALGELLRVLKGYVPAPISLHIEAEMVGSMAVIRHITILFVNIVGLVETTAAFDLVKVQAITLAIQSCIYDYQGIIKELCVDDKGLVLVSAFGIPPTAAAQAASRAVQCALAIQKSLNILNCTTYSGISSGLVYCSSLGGQNRREFALTSNNVNLAARLMGHSKKQNGSRDKSDIQCDSYTSQEARDSIHFEKVQGSIQLKGIGKAIQVWKPVSTRNRTKAKASTSHFLTFNEYLIQMHEWLGAVSIEPSIIDIVWAKAEGSVQISHEMVKFLQKGDFGALDRHGTWRLKYRGPDVLNSIGTHIPHEIQAHLSDQFSLLTKQQRLVAQIAVVIGKEASINMILQVMHLTKLENQSAKGSLYLHWKILHQENSKKSKKGISNKSRDNALILQSFTKLQKTNILSISKKGGCQSYEFQSVMIMDALYSEIPFNQRTHIHKAVAACYEQNLEHENWTSMYPVLVHHYMLADSEEKASSSLHVMETIDPDFLRRWLILQFSSYLPPTLQDITIERVYGAIIALPFIRGLIKAVRAKKAGKATIRAAKLLHNQVASRVTKAIQRRRNSIRATKVEEPTTQGTPNPPGSSTTASRWTPIFRSAAQPDKATSIVSSKGINDKSWKHCPLESNSAHVVQNLALRLAASRKILQGIYDRSTTLNDASIEKSIFKSSSWSAKAPGFVQIDNIK